MKHLITIIGLLVTTATCAKNHESEATQDLSETPLASPSDEGQVQVPTAPTEENQSTNPDSINPAPAPSEPDVVVHEEPAATVPESLSVVEAKSIGSGCAKDSALVTVSEDRLSLVVDVGALEASASKNGSLLDRRKTCNLMLKLAHTEGYLLKVVGVVSELDAKVGKDLDGALAVKARIQGATPEEEAKAEQVILGPQKAEIIPVAVSLDHPVELADLSKTLLLTLSNTLADNDGTVKSNSRSHLALTGPVVLKLEFTKLEQ